MAAVSKREWAGPAGEAKSAWIVRFLDGRGVKRQKTFVRKKEADAYAGKVEAERGAGMLVADGESMSIAKVCRAYIEDVERMVRDRRMAMGTLAKERFYFDRHIVPALGAILVADLSKADVDRFLRHLGEKGALRGTTAKGKTLRPATVKQISHALSRAVDYALRRGMTARNVVREVGRWSEHRIGRQDPIRTFRTEQVRTLIVSMQGDKAIGWTPRARALTRCTLYLAAFCGMRLGEVLGLTADHVDFDRRVIRIRHSLDAWDNLKGPKTAAGRREVPLPGFVADELAAWARYVIPNDRNLLFRTRTGAKLTTASFHRHYWQKALDGADLGPDAAGRRLHFHALRHFAASIFVESRIPLSDVAEMLGHSSFDMTLQVYAHPVSEKEHRLIAVDAIANAMRPALV